MKIPLERREKATRVRGKERGFAFSVANENRKRFRKAREWKETTGNENMGAALRIAGFCVYNRGTMTTFHAIFRRVFRNRNWVCVLAALWATGFCQASRAAEAVTMQIDSPLALPTKPLGMQIKTGRWFPVAVTLSNSGEAVKGRVQLQLTASGGGSNRSAVFASDVDLPTNARKRVWLYGRGEGAELDGATVSFSGRGFKTRVQNISLRPLDNGERSVLTISDSQEKLGFLNGLKGKQLAAAAELTAENQQAQFNSSGQSSTRNTFLRALGSTREWIPDRAIGLESADIVVLRDFAQSALTPEQLNALRAYVAQGGTLVVFGGADWQRLSTSPLKDLWPLDPTSSGAATASQTAQIVARYVKTQALSGADKLGGAPLILLRGNLKKDATTLVSSGNSPLICARDFGAGRVILLCADPSAPPFLGWSGQSALWSEIAQNLPRFRRLESVGREGFSNAPYASYGGYSTQPTGSTEQLLSVIKKLPQLQTPPTSTIAWFLALYVFCLVPLNYFVLRGIDKREMAWLTIPAIAILFSVASYLAARNIKGTDLLVRQVNIVQGSAASGVARSDAMLWLYSPRRANYDVSSSGSLVLADYVSGAFGAPASSLSLNQPDASQPFRVEGAAVKMWDEADFVAQGTIETKAGVSLTASGNGYRVLNRTPFALRGTVLLKGNKLFRCGDLASGAASQATFVGTALSGEDLVARVASASELTKIFPAPKSAPNGSKNPALADSTLRDLATATLRAAFSPDAISPDARGQNLQIVAWGTEPVTPLKIEGENVRQQSVTLFLLRLPDTK